MIDLYYLSLLSKLNSLSMCCLILTITIIFLTAFCSFIEGEKLHEKYYTHMLIALVLSTFFYVILPSQKIIDVEIKQIEVLK